MPIYEYECTECSHQFEVLLRPNDNTDVECPECHRQNARRLLSAGSVRPNGIPTGSGGFNPPPCSGSGSCSRNCSI